MEEQTNYDDDSLGVQAVLWMRRKFCALHGHDNLLHFERDRMFLKCASCGYESPGWELAESRPTLRIKGDAQRHVLVPPQLVGARRVA
jgi:hypothetical protein